MGIKNLHHFLRKACPLIYTENHLSKYAYKKLAVDTSIFMCRFKTTYGRQWLDAFLQLVAIMRENEVHPVFVYDAKAPIEKEEERKLRTLARIKTKEKADHICASWETYKSLFKDDEKCFGLNGVIPLEREKMTPELCEFINKGYAEYEAHSIVAIDNAIDHMLNTLLSIRSEDFELTRTFFDIMGVPYLLATGEAEATCAMLCRMGLVDAVLSEDTDVLNYKAPRFLHKLNMNQQTLVEIEYEDMLSRLDMTEDQFLDFCIMCGTDYNNNLYKIGPEKSFRLLKKHGSIENIKINNPTLDMSSFPYLRSRELFKDDQHLTPEIINAVRCCGVPEIQKLVEFCFKNNCRFDLARLIRSFTINPHVEFE
jgi:5'-3' exonuclease